MKRPLLAGLAALALIVTACSGGTPSATDSTTATSTPAGTSQTAAASASSDTGASSAGPTGESAQSGAADAGTVTITDMKGRQVTIPKNVKRILALHPIPTDLINIMAPDKQVSVDMVFASRLKTAQPQYTAEQFQRLSALPVTGVFFKGLNTEQLVDLHPDVVIDLVTDPNIDKLQQQLKIPFIAVSKAPTSSYEQTIRLLGKILNDEDRANELADFWAGTISDVQARTATVPDADRKSVIYVGQNGNLLATPGKNTVFGSTIDTAGGKNVADELTGAAATTEGNSVSMEQILTWNPEVIIAAGAEAKAKILADPKWKSIKAVKDGHVYSPRAFSGMDGLQAVLGMVWLQGVLLDGDSATAQARVDQVTQQYYKLFYGTELGAEYLARQAK